MPGPPGTSPRTPGVLRIGRELDNDFVIDLPTISGYHARVVWEGDAGGCRIEDLGSSNGTAIGSPDRKITRSPFTASDTIYLGSHPVPASVLLDRLRPPTGPVLTFRGRDLVIGRSPENDAVFDIPTVSGRHARLRCSGDRVFLEDLGSSNGTFVNGRRIDGTVDVRAGDIIGLGSHSIVLAVEPTPAPASGPVVEARLASPALEARDVPEGRDRPGEVAWFSRPAAIFLVLLLQAPLAALGVVFLGGGRGGTAPSSAPLLAWLSLAAVWFGLSDVILGDLADGGRLRSLARSDGLGPLARHLGWVAGLCVAQCLLCWAIAASLGGLRGPAPASLGFLILGAWVGMAIGLAVVCLVPRPLAPAVLPLLMVGFWVLCGEFRPLAEMAPWARAAAGVDPARWGFEGLLLLEPVGPEAGDAGAGRDLAEGYFPAETERTGPRGAAMALGLLLIGASGSAAFIARASRPTG